MTKLNKKSCVKLAKSLRKGDILHWINYKLDSGKKKNKILIILSNYGYKFIIFALTTSKTEIYNKDPFARIDIISFSAKQIKCFPLKTIIDLKRLKEMTVNDFGKKFYNNKLKLIGRLPDEEIKAIDSVIEKAITLGQNTKNLILDNKVSLNYTL